MLISFRGIDFIIYFLRMINDIKKTQKSLFKLGSCKSVIKKHGTY
jgi:hypothetical protein